MRKDELYVKKFEDMNISSNCFLNVSLLLAFEDLKCTGNFIGDHIFKTRINLFRRSVSKNSVGYNLPFYIYIFKENKSWS